MAEFLVKFFLATFCAGVTSVVLTNFTEYNPAFWLVWLAWLAIVFLGVFILENCGDGW